MTAGREAPRRRPGARRPALLLLVLAAGVAGTLAWASLPRDDAVVAGDRAAPAPVASASSGVTAPITASSAAPAPGAAPEIGVRLPSPSPAAAPAADAGSATERSTARSWTAAEWSAYCSSPANPTGASSARGLLDAANVERARLGIAPLAWSASLAAAAQAWSAQMVADDQATPGMADALAHSPSLPGRAQNVGVAANSGGLSESRAAGILAAGWMRSPGHCRNLMNPAYSTMGAGLAVTSDGTTWYGTEDFA